MAAKAQAVGLSKPGGKATPDHRIRDAIYMALIKEHVAINVANQIADDFYADSAASTKAIAGVISLSEPHLATVGGFVAKTYLMGYRSSQELRRAMALAIMINSAARGAVGGGGGGAALKFMEVVSKTWPKLRPLLQKLPAKKLAAATPGALKKVGGALGIYTAAFESYQAMRTGDWGVALGEIIKYASGEAIAWTAAVDAIQNILEYVAPGSPMLTKYMPMIRVLNPLAYAGTGTDVAVSLFTAGAEMVRDGSLSSADATARLERLQARMEGAGHVAALSEFGYNLGGNAYDLYEAAKRAVAGTTKSGAQAAAHPQAKQPPIMRSGPR